jgi:hypothetical protein
VVNTLLTHLHPEIRALAVLPAAERLARLPSERWIGYSRAHQALAQMEALFAGEPNKVRPKNLLIVGPTNNGKTMIAEKFRRIHPRCSADDHEIIPVLMVQMPPEATVPRLYSALLTVLGSPVGLHSRNDIREALVLRLLRDVGLRLLIIDELHNMLGASARRQRELLNWLRFLGNELRIPIVCLGLRDAWLALRSDDQLENRFHPFLLPLWEDGEEFARLLASFETMLPLREPSHLAEEPLRPLILRRSEGPIGEIAALLVRAATAALLNGDERIDPATIERADYQPPSIRRQMIERALR